MHQHLTNYEKKEKLILIPKHIYEKKLQFVEILCRNSEYEEIRDID